MQFLFPAVPQHKITNQMAKIREELDELENFRDEDNLVEEYFDVVHALEQKGREIMAYVGEAKFWNGKDVVLTKNYSRGLYASSPNQKVC